jgi:DNA invertase Pin-like site-specific DNA recombinase
MFIRGYLRASTQDQDANRARAVLSEFAITHGHKVAAFYIENVSGAKLERDQLNRLIDDSHEGDVLLIEQVDRLSRLQADDWDDLKARIQHKGITIVSLDLHTSHAALTKSDATDDFTKGMIKAVNGMLLDMLAVVARKDYEDRRRRQAEGINTAKAKGVYKGRKTDEALHDRIRMALEGGHSLRKTAALIGCALSTVQRVQKDMKAAV